MSTQIHSTTTPQRPPLPELQGFELAPATNSSFIALFGFHHETNVLHVEFNSGHCARYKSDVGLFREWKAADSVGKFFHARVRGKLPEIPREEWLPPAAIIADVVTQDEAVIEEPSTAEIPDFKFQISGVAAVEDAPAVAERVTEVETKLATDSDELYLQAARVEDIHDQPSYDVAAELFAAVLDMEAEIKKEYGSMKKKAYDAHREVCDREKARLEPIVIAKHRLSALMGDWDAQQRRLQEEKQREARLLADQQSRDESLAAAVEAEQQGAEPEEVEMILSTPAPVAVASVGASYTKSFSTRQKWMPFLDAGKTELDALLAIVKAAADNPDAFLSCLQLDMSEIKRRADKQKAAFKVPGFYARPETKATGQGLKRR